MLKKYELNVKELLDEGMDEPITWKVGEEAGIYPLDINDKKIGVEDGAAIERIEKLSDKEYKVLASYGKDDYKVEFSFTTSQGAKIELSTITAVDCMLGYSIENCLFFVNGITENYIELQIIGVERESRS